MTAQYKYVKRKNHPLSPPSGRIPEHRIVLWEKIGPGTHPCFDCGEPVTWSDRRTAPGALVVNHMDKDTRNNTPENLEPSCQSCNIRHGKVFEGDDWIVGADGKRTHVEWRICGKCTKRFPVERKLIRHAERVGKKNVGKYCSQTCLWQRNH